MKKLKNVLYILTPESYLFCQNETIAIKIGGVEKARIPAHTIESIVCLCNTTVSTPFIGFCSERQIGLSFLSEFGKFYGRLEGKVHGNVLLRSKQFKALDDKKISSSIVRNILFAKIANCKSLISRCKRETKEASKINELVNAAEILTNLAEELSNTDDIDRMRGLEGAAASVYFGVFDHFIKIDNASLKFDKRSKRPPHNNFNALLSFIYMLLKNDYQTALESVGLDPAVGFLHTLRSGRPSLALDLMEELRSPLCDRLAISLVNLKQMILKIAPREYF